MSEIEKAIEYFEIVINANIAIATLMIVLKKWQHSDRFNKILGGDAE